MIKSLFRSRNLAVFCFLPMLAACSRAGSSQGSQPPTSTTLASPAPTQTALPPTATLEPTLTATLTALPPTATELPSPTVTESPTETPPPSPTLIATLAPTGSTTKFGAGDTALMYFIQTETGGPVGCGDSAIGVGSGVSMKGDSDDILQAALQKLLSYDEKYVAGLYNPLYLSTIKVNSVSISNGLATVNLRGKYRPSGDECDNLRVKAQVWLTVRQFKEVEATNIYLNNVPFGDLVSNDK
jgi:hypothetical protein